MEPHELDNYIGSKIREAEKAGSESETGGVNRVWSAIEPQLEKQRAFHWVKMAAVILLLLMPSVYLYLRNREQGRQILSLNTKLTLIEKDYRQKLQAFAANQPVVVQYDTVRLTRIVESKIVPETIEVVKFRTDTVIIYLTQEGGENLAESENDIPSTGEPESTWQETVKTEYILPKDAVSTIKKRKNRSFQISLGSGNKSASTEPELAIKTKL